MGIDMEQELLNEALALEPCKTTNEVVSEALSEYIQRRRQMGILGLAGKVDYDPGYDYKVERRRR